MEAITSLHYLNFSPQSNFTTKFSSIDVAETLLETSSPPSPEPLSSNLSVNKIETINSLKANHAQIIKNARKRDSGTGSLILSYLEFGDFHSAAKIFFVDYAQNYLYWSSFLDDFVGFGGDPFEILEVYVELQNRGLVFGSQNLVTVLKLCAYVKNAWLGLELHACLIKRGFDLDVYVKRALMKFYLKCWEIDTGDEAFQETSDHNSLLWAEKILINLKAEKWFQSLNSFRDMQFSSVKANSNVIAKILQACGKVGALDEGRQIHSYIIRNGLESNLWICNSLIYMYSRNGNLELARAVFDLMENRNLSTWNFIISSYTAHGYLDHAWKLFHEMEADKVELDTVTWNSLLSGHFLHGSYKQVLDILQKMQNAGFNPNTRSIVYILQAVSELRYINLGKEIHCYVTRHRLDSDLHVKTTVLDMYVKNNDLTKAQAFFDCMKERNVVAWNSLISGYCFNGNLGKAVSLLNQMEKEGIRPDLVTYNNMISGYSMTGKMKEALAMIRKIKDSGLKPNVVSWTSLISGSSQKGNHRSALEFCYQMQVEGIKPNSNTISSLLRACAGLSLLQKGKEVHCHSIRNGYLEDTFVQTALIDMYSKCGSLKKAYIIFQKAHKKTIASWNSMIAGFGIYGRGEDAISLFHRLQEEKLWPDAITFTALLSGCKYSGLVDEGWKYFDSMEIEYGIIPNIQHYSCMVDLLGRGGYLDEAWDFIERMPVEPDATIWGAFLLSCRIHNNLELGEIAAKELFKMEPRNPANYVLLMNMYAAAERWDDVENIKEIMDCNSVKIGNVWSWTEISRKVYVFHAVGKSHPDEGEIYFELYKLISEIKDVGYVPDTRCVYQNVDEEEREKALLSHTEKMAITYGLIKAKDRNTPIRVIKNARICPDCHTFAKCVSFVRKRRIILKDGTRFHYFRGGKCSCGDCW